MKTRFDAITDSEIENAITSLELSGKEDEFVYYKSLQNDVEKIAMLASVMGRYKSWIGASVTIYSESGEDGNFDGNHRVRACKFLARTHGLQIQIPVRYSCLIATP